MCREGVVVVVGVVADHSDWSICGVLKLDAPAAGCDAGSMISKDASQLACRCDTAGGACECVVTRMLVVSGQDVMLCSRPTHL